MAELLAFPPSACGHAAVTTDVEAAMVGTAATGLLSRHCNHNDVVRVARFIPLLNCVVHVNWLVLLPGIAFVLSWNPSRNTKASLSLFVVVLTLLCGGWTRWQRRKLARLLELGKPVNVGCLEDHGHMLFVAHEIDRLGFKQLFEIRRSWSTVSGNGWNWIVLLVVASLEIAVMALVAVETIGLKY